MKNTVKFFVLLTFCAMMLTACAQTEQGSSESSAPSAVSSEAESQSSGSQQEESSASEDDKIMEEVLPYLENTQKQDPANYSSMEEFLMANFGLGEADIADAQLYMGAPNGNTTYFAMLTPTPDADTELIREKLENNLKGWVETSQQGYTQGYTEYSVIESGGKIFAVMHEDAKQYQKLTAYLESL